MKFIVKEQERTGGVIYQTLLVQRNGLASNSRPRIQIIGNWILEMGFIDGALIQSLPEPNGLVFNLCNENINYSELFHSTKEKGGTLMRVYHAKGNRNEPSFATSGNHIYKGGLKQGDAIIAKGEPGCIRIRKASENVRLINVARAKNIYTGEPIPKVKICGKWLNDIGFTTDTIATAALEPGCITFTAYDKAVVYSDMVKLARRNKMRLIQVSARFGAPCINFSAGMRIAQAGFGAHDIFSAGYEYGVIKLQKFDPQKVGF